MPRTQEVTAYYIRTQNGETFYVDTLKEALDEFLGDDGYRLTLSSDNKELVIRKSYPWTESDNGKLEALANLVYRNKE
jgi:hypothetical protein